MFVIQASSANGWALAAQLNTVEKKPRNRFEAMPVRPSTNSAINEPIADYFVDKMAVCATRVASKTSQT